MKKNISEIQILQKDFQSVDWKSVIDQQSELIDCENLKNIFEEKLRKLEEGTSEWKSFFFVCNL